jgi:hypothetical protein
MLLISEKLTGSETLKQLAFLGNEISTKTKRLKGSIIGTLQNSIIYSKRAVVGNYLKVG